LRTELYSGLRDAIMRGDTTPAYIGKRIVLPLSFKVSPRYMVENYQDGQVILIYLLLSHAMQNGQRLKFPYPCILVKNIRIDLI
jgi:hypothetical protein